MKNVIYISIFATLFFSFASHAQNVGIGTSNPNSSAALDVSSSDKGMLVPRMSSASRTAITSPATGLTVFDTSTKSFWFFNGYSWVELNTTTKNRRIYIPAGAMNYAPSAANTPGMWGISMTPSANPVGFLVPRPTDWDSTKTVSITLYYAFPSISSNTFVSWTLIPATNSLNAPLGEANNGWDIYGTNNTENSPSTPVFAAPDRNNIAKSVTWVAKYSSNPATWYFGVGISTNNTLSLSPMWQFGFKRGSAATGETYTGSLIVNAASIDYQAK